MLMVCLPCQMKIWPCRLSRLRKSDDPCDQRDSPALPNPSTLVLVSIYSTNIPTLFLTVYYSTVPYEEMLCLRQAWLELGVHMYFLFGTNFMAFPATVFGSWHRYGRL